MKTISNCDENTTSYQFIIYEFNGGWFLKIKNEKQTTNM